MDGVIVIYVVFCLAAAAREYTGDAWIYYGLAMAGAFMFVLDRLKMNMPPSSCTRYPGRH